MTAAGYVVRGMKELVTMVPLANSLDFKSIDQSSIGRLSKSPWLAISHDGTVAQWGEGPTPAPWKLWPETVLDGGLILPGFIDSHTHPLWAGSRADEFVLKAQGQTYQEIAAKGGGILASVQSTRRASDEELLKGLLSRLKRMVSQGITSFEVKSGYGLSVKEELRHLRLLNEAKALLPCHLHVTCLALHAPSPEAPNKETYISQCLDELLPEVRRLGLAQSVDAFVEKGYFEPQEVLSYLQKASNLGLRLRLHADEFQDSGAAALGLELGATSLDHLQHVDPKILPRWTAKSPRTVATLLPGTSLYSKIPFANGKALRRSEIPVAIATDFNPGSCLIYNLQLVASLAAVHCGLSLEECLAAITVVPAFSLGLLDVLNPDKPGLKGALAQGFDADFVHLPFEDLASWLADFGQTQVTGVWIKGRYMDNI